MKRIDLGWIFLVTTGMVYGQNPLENKLANGCFYYAIRLPENYKLPADLKTWSSVGIEGRKLHINSLRVTCYDAPTNQRLSVVLEVTAEQAKLLNKLQKEGEILTLRLPPPEEVAE